MLQALHAFFPGRMAEILREAKLERAFRANCGEAQLMDLPSVEMICT